MVTGDLINDRCQISDTIRGLLHSEATVQPARNFIPDMEEHTLLLQT